MISKEEENKTRQVRENLRNQKSLYDTFKDVYDKAKPVSRILMMLKIVQVVDPQQKRKDKNLTQKQLAEKIGVTDRAISKWERGRIRKYHGKYYGFCQNL